MDAAISVVDPYRVLDISGLPRATDRVPGTYPDVCRLSPGVVVDIKAEQLPEGIDPLQFYNVVIVGERVAQGGAEQAVPAEHGSSLGGRSGLRGASGARPHRRESRPLQASFWYGIKYHESGLVCRPPGDESLRAVVRVRSASYGNDRGSRPKCGRSAHSLMSPRRRRAGVNGWTVRSPPAGPSPPQAVDCA